MREEIVVALVMFAISIGGSIATRNDRKWSAFFLFMASVAGSLCAGMGIRFREIVEGPFGFLDSMLCVASASVLVATLEASGAFRFLFGRFVKIRNATLKSMAILFLVALPAMLTGFAGASIATTGRMVGNGIGNRRKAALVVGAGSFLGVILPPNCIPAMIAANGAGSVLPTPYNGFFLPLLVLGFPAFATYAILEKGTLASVSCLEGPADRSARLPALVIALVGVAVIIDGVLGSVVYLGGNTLVFFLASILVMILAKGFGGFRKTLDIISEGLMKAVLPISIVFALGSFIEVSSMTGVRGLFSLWILPYGTTAVMLSLMALALALGFFLSIPIPAFLLAYAVFPIGWLASPVIVAGCSSVLAIIALITFRGGIMRDCSEVFGLESPLRGSEILRQASLPAVLVFVVGVLMVLFGSSMSFLVL